jgi:uncharacterized membrane-anchored protein YitT (DUF2179 family)
MRFRTQVLLFVILTVVGACVLWFLPSPVTTISSEGTKTTNWYWWWLAGAFLVAVGCAAEYFWITGADLVAKHLSRRQKIAIGTVLLSVALVAASYGLIQYYR